MPITDDLRKALSDPTPLYFAAGTADLAAEKLRDVPALLEKLRAQAPERLAAARRPDLTKVREQAQSLALQSVGRAAEYAVKARETYDVLADRGRQAVGAWRGGPAAEAYSDVEMRIEREPVTVAEPEPEPAAEATAEAKTETKTEAQAETEREPKAEPKAGPKAGPKASAGAEKDSVRAKPAAKKAPSRRTTAGDTAPKK